MRVENLVYSLEATMPVFLLMIAGMLFRRIGLFSEAFTRGANAFVFRIALPVSLFVQLSGVEILSVWDTGFVLFCAGSTTIGFFGAWILTKLLMKDKNSVGEFVQACYRSSTAVLGLALIQNIYGTTGMAGMMVLGAVPLYNVYAVIVLQTESPINKKGEKNIQRALKGIITNPILIGVILGLVASLINIKFPTIIDTSLNYVARIATPLAVICIGGEFSFKNAFKSLKKSSLAAAVKIILLPLVFVPIAILMGFYTDKLVAILVMLAGPTTPSCFIMA